MAFGKDLDEPDPIKTSVVKEVVIADHKNLNRVQEMLGKSKLVIPTLEEYPNLINSIGSHGFTLLHHANVGGVDSLEIKEYLIENGLSETQIKIK